jgi:hypothetical protein
MSFLFVLFTWFMRFSLVDCVNRVATFGGGRIAVQATSSV